MTQFSPEINHHAACTVSAGPTVTELQRRSMLGPLGVSAEYADFFIETGFRNPSEAQKLAEAGKIGNVALENTFAKERVAAQAASVGHLLVDALVIPGVENNAPAAHTLPKIPRHGMPNASTAAPATLAYLEGADFDLATVPMSPEFTRIFA